MFYYREKPKNCSRLQLSKRRITVSSSHLMERKQKSLGNFSRPIVRSIVSFYCHVLQQFHRLQTSHALICQRGGEERKDCTSLSYAQSLPALAVTGLSPGRHRSFFIHTGIYAAVPTNLSLQNAPTDYSTNSLD